MAFSPSEEDSVQARELLGRRRSGDCVTYRLLLALTFTVALVIACGGASEVEVQPDPDDGRVWSTSVRVALPAGHWTIDDGEFADCLAIGRIEVRNASGRPLDTASTHTDLHIGEPGEMHSLPANNRIAGDSCEVFGQLHDVALDEAEGPYTIVSVANGEVVSTDVTADVLYQGQGDAYGGADAPGGPATVVLGSLG